MRIAVLIKQVPQLHSIELGADLRVDRQNAALEMNAYCRRAVSKGVELARATGGSCTAYTLGPASAEDVLREAIAAGADAGVLITGSEFAGSDTLATARALGQALHADGPWDLILVGRNSVDADTGQVGPEVAELLDLPFASAVRHMDVGPAAVAVRCELDDGWRAATVTLPAVLAVAERLTSPCKMPPEARRAVQADKISRRGARDLGPGPWGAAGSPTTVGRVRSLEITRHRRKLEGPVAAQVACAAELLRALDPGLGDPEPTEPDAIAVADGNRPPPATTSGQRPALVVVAEPRRLPVTAQMLTRAAELADEIGAEVVCVGPDVPQVPPTSLCGADRLVGIAGTTVEEDHAAALADWISDEPPWGVLLPGTTWGREVASRLAARLGLGLTGDAVEISVEDGRLVCWKPAFGGKLVAAVTTSSDVQLATVRPGVFAKTKPTRPARSDLPLTSVLGRSRGRVVITKEAHDGGLEELLGALHVVSVGQGVHPEDYALLDPLVQVLNAELAATRRVTDQGWLPRGKQLGITGHAISPHVAVVVGASGNFNHMVGIRAAGIVIAINSDPTAAVFEWADIGIVADWRDAVPLLARELAASVACSAPTASPPALAPTRTSRQQSHRASQTIPDRSMSRDRGG